MLSLLYCFHVNMANTHAQVSQATYSVVFHAVAVYLLIFAWKSPAKYYFWKVLKLTLFFFSSDICNVFSHVVVRNLTQFKKYESCAMHCIHRMLHSN